MGLLLVDKILKVLSHSLSRKIQRLFHQVFKIRYIHYQTNIFEGGLQKRRLEIFKGAGAQFF